MEENITDLLEDEIVLEALEDSNAKRTLLHLGVCFGIGLALDYMFATPFIGFWAIMSSIMYILYVVVLITKYRSDNAKSLAIIEKTKENEIEEKEIRINIMANALREKANELESKANAFEKMQNDLQTLGKERQMLTEQVQTLGKQLADAKQTVVDAKQSHADAIGLLKQTHNKNTSSLVTEKEVLADKAEKLKEELQAIKLAERQKYVKKAFSASKSANKGDLEKVKASMEIRAREENEPLFLDFDKYL